MGESLRLFSDMRRGLMDEGSATLRCWHMPGPNFVVHAVSQESSVRMCSPHSTCVSMQSAHAQTEGKGLWC